MGEFVRKYQELSSECITHLKDYLSKNGNRVVFATEEEKESEDFAETTWEYPQATYVGKHEHTYYYTITSITLEDGNLWFNGICIHEDSDEYNFGETEVDLACLCDSCDLLTSKN